MKARNLQKLSAFSWASSARKSGQLLRQRRKLRILPGQNPVPRLHRDRPFQIFAGTDAIACQAATECQREQNVLALRLERECAVQMMARYFHVARIQSLHSVVEMIVRGLEVHLRPLSFSVRKSVRKSAPYPQCAPPDRPPLRQNAPGRRQIAFARRAGRLPPTASSATAAPPAPGLRLLRAPPRLSVPLPISRAALPADAPRRKPSPVSVPVLP